MVLRRHGIGGRMQPLRGSCAEASPPWRQRLQKPEAPSAALDANVFDCTISERESLSRAFRRLVDEGRVKIWVPMGVSAEVSHPDAPTDIRVALAAAVPLPRARPTARQHIDRIRVRAILRGDGRPGKHDADASHLSDAAEAGCGFFVTQDGKILRKRDTLALALPETLRIVSLSELVDALEGASTDGSRLTERPR